MYVCVRANASMPLERAYRSKNGRKETVAGVSFAPCTNVAGIYTDITGQMP